MKICIPNLLVYLYIITFDKVQTIWFDNTEQMGIFIFNLEISTTFAPKHLMKVDENIESYFNVKDLPKRRKIQRPPKNRFTRGDFQKKLNRYIKLLGWFSVQKHILQKNENEISFTNLVLFFWRSLYSIL